MSNNNKPKLQVQNISCVFPESQELGGLYLGNMYGAQNHNILKEYGIRAVLTTSIQTPITYNPEDIPFHLKIEAHDKDDYAILDHMDQCINFIVENRKFTNVYVHCYAGVSRSVSIIVAYLIRVYRWDLDRALSFTICKRVVAKPNDGFMEQLKKFQLQHKKPVRKQQRLEKPPMYMINPSFIHENLKKERVQRDVKKMQTSSTSFTPIYSSVGKKYNYNDTPIPKILTNGRKQYRPVEQQLKSSTFQAMQQRKTKSRVIRPKDLPGYKNY